MKTYESVIIVKPQLSDGEVGEFVNKAKALITSKGGEVTSDPFCRQKSGEGVALQSNYTKTVWL